MDCFLLWFKAFAAVIFLVRCGNLPDGNHCALLRLCFPTSSLPLITSLLRPVGNPPDRGLIGPKMSGRLSLTNWGGVAGGGYETPREILF